MDKTGLSRYQPRMRAVVLKALKAAVFVSACLALAGCVTSKKYKMAKKDTPPAATLDWSSSVPGAGLTLQTVIVFKGPGSWKREARWDEYVVALQNHGTDPLVIEGAVLVDVLGVPREWGTDPWRLEKLSYTNWEKYGKTGLKVVAGAGAVALYGTAVMASGIGGLMAPTAAAGAGLTVLEVIPVVAVVDITAVAIMNHQNKEKVTAEFNRRRLPLPLTLSPGGSVMGSCFFPMTPGPTKLFVRGRRGAEPVVLSLELKPLSGLHLRPATASPATPP